MSNLVLAIEHWRPGSAPGIYAKFAAEGRGLPDSVRILGSWTDPALTTCWQVMEGATADDLAVWVAPYTDRVTQDVAEVEQALPALAPEECAAMIHAGLLSLDDRTSVVSQDDIDAAWRTEFRRRIDDVKSGKIQLVSHDETVSQARATLAARQT